MRKRAYSGLWRSILVGGGVVLLGLITGAAYANVTVTALLDKNVLRVGEEAVLKVNITTDGGESVQEPMLPVITGLNFVKVGNSSSSTFSMGGGVTRSVINYEIDYAVVAMQEGKYTLDKISASSNRGTVTARPIMLTVLSEGAPTPTPLPGAPASPPPNTYGVYFTVQSDKKEAYVGEAIMLTYTVWLPVNLLIQGIQLDDRQGQFHGFWTENFDISDERYRTREMFNGRPYRKIPVKRYFLFPLTPGEHTVDPLKLICLIPTNPMGSLGLLMGRPSQVAVQSDPVKIKVKPLPEEGKPGTFKGAVGAFNITARVESAEVKEGDPVTLKILLEGIGNLRNAPPPVMPDLSKFDVYDPTTKENVQVLLDQVRGQVETTYVLIPHDVNSNEIGPLKYPFFDPVQKKYVTLETKPIQLKILPSGHSGLRGSGPPGVNRRVITRIGEDFRFNAVTPLALSTVFLPIYRNASCWMLFALPVLLLLAGYAQKQRTEFFADHPAALKSKKAPRLAGKLLSQARRAIQEGTNEKIYSALAKAITDYIDNRWNLACAGLTSEELRRTLQDKGVQAQRIDEVIQTLQEFDAARFSGAARDGSQRQQDYAKAEQLLAALMRKNG